MMDWLALSLQNGYAIPSSFKEILNFIFFVQGQYLGTLENVNHLDLVGWINTARYKWAEITGREIKFRPATFYLGIADWLAAEVEGIEKESDETEGEQLQGKVGAGVDVSDDVAGGTEAEEGHGDMNATGTEKLVDMNADPTHPKAR
jgi:hypothetical protein